MSQKTGLTESDVNILLEHQKNKNQIRTLIPASQISNEGFEVVPLQSNTRRTSVPKEIVDKLKATLNTMVQSNGLTSENLLYIITNLMHMTGQYKTLSGAEKKEIVVLLINQVIDETDMEKVNKDILKLMMITVVPGAVDTIIEVSKGGYKFKDNPKLSSLLTGCCN